MKIVHRVGFNSRKSPDFKFQVDKMGIKYKAIKLPGGSSLVHFDIAESHPRWEQVAELIKLRGASDMVRTMFTKKEIERSEWVRVEPFFEVGYPQPREGWLASTYENRCPQCGADYHQKAVFRLKKEPKLGKNDFMCLTRTYEVFCTPRVLEALEKHKIQGYKIWDAVIHKTSLSSVTVSQLFIPAVAEPALIEIDDLRRETCTLCHITKYYPHRRGWMHLKRDALIPDADIMRSAEWFGSGHAAYREILVSNKLARLILDNGWKGVALKAVKVV